MRCRILKEAAARLSLALLLPEDLPGQVKRARLKGELISEPSVLEDVAPSDFEELRREFASLLKREGIPAPDRREAVMILARITARKILDRSLTALAGAEEIFRLALRAEQRIPELDTFVYAASEWPERPADDSIFEPGVRTAAEDLCKGDERQK